VARLLALGGTFVLVSFRARTMIEKFLQVPGVPFSLRCEKIATPAASKIEAHIFFLKKTAPIAGLPMHDGGSALGALRLEAVKQFQDSVIEWWHREQDPILNQHTQSEISAKFHARLKAKGLAAGARLALDDVYPLLFSEDMRSEYGYDFGEAGYARVRAHTRTQRERERESERERDTEREREREMTCLYRARAATERGRRDRKEGRHETG